jgi:ribonuclease E
MTFYEAALRVLEGAGHPLHFQEITERSIAENLLSHVGKTPEQTMLARLAAMAKRKGDRRVIVTAKDTFALAEWTVPEDPEALAQTGIPEPHPEEGLPPLRPLERHPEVRRENVRAAGRGADRKRRRDEDEERGGRRRRYPPVPEVAFDILSEAVEALSPEAILEQGRELSLVSKELAVEALLTALLEDNQRRIDAGRRPQFLYQSGMIALERAGSPSEAPPLELQAAFAAALGIPVEDGRPVFRRDAEEPAAAAAGESPIEAARAALKETRKAMARALRQQLQALEPGTFERATFKMLHGHDFRELKVAKRSKDGPVITARRKEGSIEMRFAIRVHRGGQVDRKVVQELRRDLGHYNAQVGLVVSPGELRGDARGEAQASGALVMLWTGDALAEKFVAAGTGVKVVKVELFEADSAFFAQMEEEAEQARQRREERQRDRVTDRDRKDDAPAVKADAPADADLDAATAFVGGAAAAEATEETAEEGEERRRRRRRRRGRRGRGSREENGSGEASAADGADATDASADAQSEDAATTGAEAGADVADASEGADTQPGSEEAAAEMAKVTHEVDADIGETGSAEAAAQALDVDVTDEDALGVSEDDALEVSDDDLIEVTGPVAVDTLMAQMAAGRPSEASPTREDLPEPTTGEPAPQARAKESPAADTELSVADEDEGATDAPPSDATPSRDD